MRREVKPSAEDEFSGNVTGTQGEETACSCRKQGRRCLTAAKGPGTACPPIATYWSVCAIRSGRGSLLIFIECPFFHFHTRAPCTSVGGETFWAEWLSLCHACFPNSKEATSSAQFLLGQGDHKVEMKHTRSVQPRASPSHPLPYPIVAGAPATSIHKNALDCLREGQIMFPERPFVVC